MADSLGSLFVGFLKTLPKVIISKIYFFFKKNKDVENDNGLNITYRDRGKGSLLYMFEKRDGVRDLLFQHFDINGNLLYSDDYCKGKRVSRFESTNLEIHDKTDLPGLSTTLEQKIKLYKDAKKKLIKLHNTEGRFEREELVLSAEGWKNFKKIDQQLNKMREEDDVKKKQQQKKSTQTYNPSTEEIEELIKIEEASYNDYQEESEEGEYKDDNDTELIVNWDDTEDIGSVKQYKGQPFTGVCVKYDKYKERVKLSQNFKDGLRSGKIKEYYDNGQLKLEGNILLDERGTSEHGVTKLWYENGQLKKETNYDHDSITSSKEWYENGSMKQEDEYECIDDWWKLKVVKKFDIDGQLISEDYYSTDGEIISKNDFDKLKMKKEHKYSNLVIKRIEENWIDHKKEIDYLGFSYVLYLGDFDEENEEWFLDEDSEPLSNILSVVHDEKNNIIYHCSDENGEEDERWGIEYPNHEDIYYPDEIDNMFKNDVETYGILLDSIIDLEKVLSKYKDDIM